MLRDFVVAVQILPIVRTRPREILLAMITMRKFNQCVSFLYEYGALLGGPLVCFQKNGGKVPRNFLLQDRKVRR